MPNISEEQLSAFGNELEKLGGKLDAIKRFAQRQVHSLSGWTPEGFHSPTGIEKMRAGAFSAREAVEKARAAGGEVPKGLLDSLAANERAQEMGLTSIPGIAKALVSKNTRGSVLKASLDQQMKGTGVGQKLLTVGLPAVGLAANAVSADDGHKGERLGADIAGTAAGMLTGGLPMAGGTALGLGAGYLGGKLGKGVDKLRGARPQVPHVQAPPNPEDARGQSVPTERVMTPAAMGQANEVIG